MKDVTIVMPAFNEVRFIEKALLSAIHQAEAVIVSDNNSTDGTKEIYQHFVDKYDNFTLIQHSKNRGVASTQSLYDLVKTEFVAYMGAHDLLSENFIAILSECLRQNPDVVMAYAPVDKIDEQDQVFDHYYMEELVEGVAEEDVFDRVLTIIECLNDCGILHGLARSEPIKNCLDVTPVAAFDHCMLCELVTYGKYQRCGQARFLRRYLNREESNATYMKRVQGDHSHNQYQRDLSYMIKRQLEILKAIECEDEQKKRAYIDKAKKALIRRFGDIERFKIDYAAVVHAAA